MNSIDNYKDLCVEIEVQSIRIKEIKNEIKQLKRSLEGPKELTGVDYSRGPAGSPIHIPLDRVMNRLMKLQKRLEMEEEILKNKSQAKQIINDKIKELSGLDYKVVYMRDVEGDKLSDIAEKLGYSQQYIKEVSARNKPTNNILTREK